MKPHHHSTISAKRHGGAPEDYDAVHNFIDSSKICWADPRHRAILHSTFGIYLAEQIFGMYITNSNGANIAVRTIAEEHVMDDLGCIPTIENWLDQLPLASWMKGEYKKTRRTIKFEDGTNE